ncbi:metallophosphoesterase [Acaryochloris marina NIES-2412]|uniref:metallophosphoesterase n=1 Tax=Acaryochloris marina TaxID=155978 RepID=UPI004058E61F
MTAPITLAQISDTHLLADTTVLLRGANPWQSFQAVLRQVSRDQPDGIFLTGDLADQGSAGAYQHLLKAILPLKIPAYWLPGNHDQIEAMHRELQSPKFYGPQAIHLGSWLLISLNSVLPSAQFGEGYLSVSTLQRLRLALTQNLHKPTVIALHHHPVAIGIDWLDQMQVQNADALITLLESFPQVKVVLFGHVHLDFQYQHIFSQRPSPIYFYGCPSTCLQVTPPVPTAHAHLPGFRLLSLDPNGTHRTWVQRVEYVQQ